MVARPRHGFALVAALASALYAFSALAADKPAVNAADAKRIAAQVQARYDATTDLSADFDQEVHIQAGSQKMRSRGKLYFHKPGRMRWEYGEPDPQIIVADGETLWVYQPADKQVLRSPFAQAFHSDTPVSFLLGVARLERDFDVSLSKNAAPGTVRLRLDPKADSKGLGMLYLDVDEKTFDIRQATIEDPLGNTTRVTLSGVKRNQGLDDDLFRFERPKGVDVIESPKR